MSSTISRSSARSGEGDYSRRCAAQVLARLPPDVRGRSCVVGGPATSTRHCRWAVPGTEAFEHAWSCHARASAFPHRPDGQCGRWMKPFSLGPHPPVTHEATPWAPPGGALNVRRVFLIALVLGLITACARARLRKPIRSTVRSDPSRCTTGRMILLDADALAFERFVAGRSVPAERAQCSRTASRPTRPPSSRLGWARAATEGGAR
jgi:hypothetical protein